MDLNHAYTKLILDECRKHGILRNQAAYILATARHESGEYKWLREIWGPTAAQKRYEGRADLGNVQRGDGKKFMGRGFVQITGRRNYTDWTRRLGVDLLKEPHLAEQPAIAARIIVEGMKLGTFTGKSLEDYITLYKSDYTGARRIVNGTDRAKLIAGHAVEYDAALKAMGYGEEKPVEPARSVPAPSPAPVPQSPPAAKPAPKRGILAIIFEIIGRILKGGR